LHHDGFNQVCPSRSIQSQNTEERRAGETALLRVEPANLIQRELHLHHGGSSQDEQGVVALVDAYAQRPIRDRFELQSILIFGF
jgi:hypothetical protein